MGRVQADLADQFHRILRPHPHQRPLRHPVARRHLIDKLIGLRSVFTLAETSSVASVFR